MIRYAKPGRRVWAFVLTVIVDLIVLELMRTIIGSGSVALPFTAWYLIHHIGLVVEGGTLGHRLMGLRVVGIDGERVSPLMALVRELAFIGLSVAPLGLGLLWMLDQRERRGWHDLVASTVVIQESLAHDLATPAWAEDPPWLRDKQPREVGSDPA